MNIVMGLTSASGVVSKLGSQKVALSLSQSKNLSALRHVPAKDVAAHLARTIESPMIRHTVFYNNNETLADEAWGAINIEPGVVALDPDIINENGLLQGREFSWDESKGGYVLNAYHQFHCVVCIRVML